MARSPVPRSVVLWGPVVAWMALIFGLSSQARVTGLTRVPDVLTHGLAYLVLSSLVSRALSAGRRPLGSMLLLAALLATLYGVSDELHQAFVPGRHADPWDVAKDALGAVLGALVYQLLAARPSAGVAR